jgi:hypothetical protein
LEAKSDNVRNWKSTLFANQASETAPRIVWHDEVRAFRSTGHIKDRDDMGMVKVLDSLNFSYELRPDLAYTETGRGKGFEGNAFSGFHDLRKVDNGHTTPPQLLQQLILVHLAHLTEAARRINESRPIERSVWGSGGGDVKFGVRSP